MQKEHRALLRSYFPLCRLHPDATTVQLVGRAYVLLLQHSQPGVAATALAHVLRSFASSPEQAVFTADSGPGGSYTSVGSEPPGGEEATAAEQESSGGQAAAASGGARAGEQARLAKFSLEVMAAAMQAPESGGLASCKAADAVFRALWTSASLGGVHFCLTTVSHFLHTTTICFHVESCSFQNTRETSSI